MAKVFFPERFYRDFDPIHHEIFNLIDNSTSQLIAIAAPRGIGKTSINNLVLPAKSTLFQDKRYIVPVSASATAATMQSENLKYELTNNPEIVARYGDISTSVFSKEQYVVSVGSHETCIMPRGAGQQIRGMLFRNSRPDLIIIDDLEDPEQVQSEEQRRKLKQWFYADLMGCVDRGRKDWKIIYLGTILSENALLEEILEDPDWDSVRLEICDDDFNTKAPNVMSSEEVRALADSYRRKGLIDVFMREYRNLPISKEDAAFKQEYFKYYDEGEANLTRSPYVENLVIVDPAKTAKMESADSAIVCVGFNNQNGGIYVRDIVSGKFHPDELYEQVGDMVKRYNCRVLGVEVTGIGEYISYPIVDYLIRKKIYVEFVALHAKGGKQEKGKIERIRSLVPLYRQGIIFHNKNVTGKLEQQLLSFPRSKLWDVMDALGYLTEMLAIGERYGTATDDEYDVLTDEYADLDDMYGEPLEDFRII
jgi:predicted phage terminase large subunit-like protein